MAKPTAADAQLILKLYGLRREAELRKARQWWVVTFSPQSADDFMKVSSAFGTPENDWLRQVLGYWGIASSLVNHGALNRKLFLELLRRDGPHLRQGKAISERAARENEEPGISRRHRISDHEHEKKP
jgi:hypothetical protein